MATKNQIIKLERIKSQAPQDLPKFVKAANLIKEIIGISATQDRLTLEEILKTLDFEPATAESNQLKQGIINKAKAKASEGMDGDGMFFLD